MAEVAIKSEILLVVGLPLELEHFNPKERQRRHLPMLHVGLAPAIYRAHDELIAIRHPHGLILDRLVVVIVRLLGRRFLLPLQLRQLQLLLLLLVLDGRRLRTRIDLPKHFQEVLYVQLGQNFVRGVNLDVGRTVLGAVKHLQFEGLGAHFFVHDVDRQLGLEVHDARGAITGLVVFLELESFLIIFIPFFLILQFLHFFEYFLV